MRESPLRILRGGGLRNAARMLLAMCQIALCNATSMAASAARIDLLQLPEDREEAGPVAGQCGAARGFHFPQGVLHKPVS